MRKIMNNPKLIVSEMLKGLSYVDEKLEYFSEEEVIARKKVGQCKVGVVSGGGAGHEPAHAGYVGEGMLDAAVAGNVFASPDPIRVLKGIKEADTGKGVLLIIKNYSGDIMNFSMAKELAEMEGIKVEIVVVKDDVAVEDSEHSDGRRGIAGTVFVHKIAGAMAERGASLEEVKRVAQKTIDNIRTMGVSLSSCTLPSAEKENFVLEEKMMEIGMGIHGEPGIRRGKLEPADQIVDEMLEKIVADLPYENGDEVAVLVNGLGATPLDEQYIVTRRINQVLEEKGISVYKYYVGEYATAIEMAGFSISLLKLDDELKEYIDHPVDTPFFKQV